MSFRARSLVLLPLLLAVACNESTGPSAARLGEPFALGVGELALIEPEQLLLGFTGVPADSRCPIDVTCVTAGDASVELWFRRPPAPRETRVLHTDGRAGDRAEYAGFEVRLLYLAPASRSDTPLDASAYRVELVVR